MLFYNSYKTITGPVEGLFRDRGSKFIAYAFPARSEEEAKSHLVSVKEKHPKARHHCWALRLSPDTSVFRLNDDGEPAGTAGRPILNTILSLGLTNVVVVVVRYFGGTLLGVPGLINAYKTATIEALNTAEVVEKTVNDVYQLNFQYPSMNDVMKIVKDEHLALLKQGYASDCEMDVEIPKDQLNKVLARLDKVENLKYIYLYTT